MAPRAKIFTCLSLIHFRCLYENHLLFSWFPMTFDYSPLTIALSHLKPWGLLSLRFLMQTQFVFQSFQMAITNSPLAIGQWPLASGHWQFAFWPLAGDHSPLTIDHWQLPIDHLQLYIGNCLIAFEKYQFCSLWFPMAEIPKTFPFLDYWNSYTICIDMYVFCCFWVSEKAAGSRYQGALYIFTLTPH